MPDAPAPRRPWWRIALDWVVTLALVLGVSSVVGWWRAPDLPDAAPPLRLTDLDGEVVDLADLRGTPVVVNFWATWCGPCRVELPMLASWARGRDDVVVLAVATDTSAAPVRRVRDDQDLPFPVLMADGATQRAWGVTTLPTTIVVDAEGRVHAAHTGLLTPPQLALMLP